MRLDLVFLIFVIATNESHGFRILGLFPLPIKSHNIFYGKLMSELAKKGHVVHVLSHYPRKVSIPNYHDINISGSLPESVSKISVQTRINRGTIGQLRYVLGTCGHKICEDLFKHPSIINLKNSSLQFDLVIAELYGTDCLLGFAHHFQAPIIGVSGTELLPWVAASLGNTDNPSYTPHYFLSTAREMSIIEKIQVLGATLISKAGYFFGSTVSSEMRAREFFGSIPHLDLLVYNISIVFLNSHLSINDPRSMVPRIIEVGGLHIESPKALPSKLEKIITSSKDGVIYFSMGTLVNMNTFPKKTLNETLKAFSEMPENVIMTGTLINVTLPKNVYMFPWVPQLDILCHPQLKVFVTHGGSMSIQEAAYCATPILGLPLFPNSERNINKYVKRGAGLMVNFGSITKELLTEAINDIKINITYRENARKISKMFKERPMSPLDTAIYWTEYVVKFGGGEHLRTRGAELIWFEYYLIDCLILVAVAQMMGFAALAVAYKYLYKEQDDESDGKHKRK